MSDQATQNPGIRTFCLTVNVSGFLEGNLGDWPANIQDKVLEALEAKSEAEELPLAITNAQCGYDEDEGFYVNVWASEVVIGH